MQAVSLRRVVNPLAVALNKRRPAPVCNRRLNGFLHHRQPNYQVWRKLSRIKLQPAFGPHRERPDGLARAELLCGASTVPMAGETACFTLPPHAALQSAATYHKPDRLHHYLRLINFHRMKTPDRHKLLASD